jgi:hypothetical protein
MTASAYRHRGVHGRRPGAGSPIGVHAILNVNTSGVGGAESAIQLSGVTATTLTDVDFVL